MTAAAKAARCHHRRRRARNPARAMRTGSVTYTSPRTLKTLAIDCQRRCPARDHQPQPRIVDPLDPGQRAMEADQDEHHGRERGYPDGKEERPTVGWQGAPPPPAGAGARRAHPGHGRPVRTRQGPTVRRT